MGKDIAFTDLVEIHERRWGTRHYKGRPTLRELMEYPFVTVWACKANFIFAVHLTIEGMSRMISGIVTGHIANPDNRKLVRIYHKQELFDFNLRIERAPAPQKARPTEGGQIATRIRSNVNRQQARRIAIVQEKLSDGVRYGHPAKARNELLPGRKRSLIRRSRS